MLTKPRDLSDDILVAQLAHAYNLSVQELVFLPLGEASWNFMAVAKPGGEWLVKVLKGDLYPPAFLVPRFLSEGLGYDFLVAPTQTNADKLWIALGQFHVVLYPFLKGKTAEQYGLSEIQWEETGRVIRALHATVTPSALQNMLKQETFSPRWGAGAREVLKYALSQGHRGTARELVEFVQGRYQEIESLLVRAAELGLQFKLRAPEFVLCHADPNQANIFITMDGRLVLLDWDEVMMAPRERDLMFFQGKKKAGFMKGYDPDGVLHVDNDAIAYYRYEWVVQEIDSYGRRVLFEDLDSTEKQHALQEFFRLFEPGNVVDAAYESDQARSH